MIVFVRRTTSAMSWQSWSGDSRWADDWWGQKWWTSQTSWSASSSWPEEDAGDNVPEQPGAGDSVSVPGAVTSHYRPKQVSPDQVVSVDWPCGIEGYPAGEALNSWQAIWTMVQECGHAVTLVGCRPHSSAKLTVKGPDAMRVFRLVCEMTRRAGIGLAGLKLPTHHDVDDELEDQEAEQQDAEVANIIAQYEHNSDQEDEGETQEDDDEPDWGSPVASPVPSPFSKDEDDESMVTVSHDAGREPSTLLSVAEMQDDEVDLEPLRLRSVALDFLGPIEEEEHCASDEPIPQAEVANEGDQAQTQGGDEQEAEVEATMSQSLGDCVPRQTLLEIATVMAPEFTWVLVLFMHLCEHPFWSASPCKNTSHVAAVQYSRTILMNMDGDNIFSPGHVSLAMWRIDQCSIIIVIRWIGDDGGVKGRVACRALCFRETYEDLPHPSPMQDIGELFEVTIYRHVETIKSLQGGFILSNDKDLVKALGECKVKNSDHKGCSSDHRAYTWQQMCKEIHKYADSRGPIHGANPSQTCLQLGFPTTKVMLGDSVPDSGSGSAPRSKAMLGDCVPGSGSGSASRFNGFLLPVSEAHPHSCSSKTQAKCEPISKVPTGTFDSRPELTWGSWRPDEQSIIVKIKNPGVSCMKVTFVACGADFFWNRAREKYHAERSWPTEVSRITQKQRETRRCARNQGLTENEVLHMLKLFCPDLFGGGAGDVVPAVAIDCRVELRWSPCFVRDPLRAVFHSGLHPRTSEPSRPRRSGSRKHSQSLSTNCVRSSTMMQTR